MKLYLPGPFEDAQAAIANGHGEKLMPPFWKTFSAWCASGLLVLVLAVAASPCPAAEASSHWAIGNWEGLSRAFEGADYRVTAKDITSGSCRYPYEVLESGPAPDPRPVRGRPERTWYEVVVELQPTAAQPEKCPIVWRILAFLIPADRPCSAEISFYATRADFEARDHLQGWGVWGRKDCPPSR